MSRILVVDDDPSLVRTLEINLRARGYTVLMARDGRTALQVATEDAPDLIVLVEAADPLQHGDPVHLDLAEHVARRDGAAVHLTPTEWRMVEALVRRPDALVRQNDLLREVWGPRYDNNSHYLRVYMAQLRRKLEQDPARPRHFLTEPGVGHRFIL